jgi:hypothetical protein
VAIWFNPIIAHQSYCISELLSSSSNNCLQYIPSTLLVTGAGRHGELPSGSSCHLGVACPAVQLVGCLDLFVPPCPSLSCAKRYDHQRDCRYGQHSRRPNQRLGRASQPVGRHSLRAQAVLHDPYIHALLRFAVGVPRRGRVVQVVGCVGRSRTARPWFGGWLLLRGPLQCTRRREGRWNRDRVVCALFGEPVDRKAVRGDRRVACCGAVVAVLGEGGEW